MQPLEQGSRDPLSVGHDAVLLDLDGVLYVGDHAVDGSADAVAALRDAGVRVAFVTNNASRTPETVATHLTELGVPASARDVVTSAQAAARLVSLAVPPGSAVLVVGGDGLDAALRERGLRPVRSAADEPEAVVQGFSQDVGWRLLAEGTYAVNAGLPWVASNLDVTVPTERGMAPGNGALVNVIAQATGRRPVLSGKPESALHLEAAQRVAARRPLVVGDRLDTDIEGANRVGAASLLVLTGVTTLLDLVLAEPRFRPTYVAENLRTGVLRPHPPVRLQPDGLWRCGAWRCASVEGALTLDGTGDPLDGIRALSVACWNAASFTDPALVRDVLETIGLT